MSVVAMAVLAVVITMAPSSSTRPADASFHLMRVYSFMGGFQGDETVQYVELRMTAPGQTEVQNQVLCFFDEMGAPWARFKFPGGVGNGTSGNSILVGSPQFDAQWPAGSPDFVFLPGNTTAIAFDASNTEPLPRPGGKIAFGSDSATQPSEMCLASFGEFDSVAYGGAYTGVVDYGTRLSDDLTITHSDGIGLVGDLCNPCARDNSMDYAVVDVNAGQHQPRNNSGNQGPVKEAGPKPTPGPTPTPGPSPTPGESLAGDMDCDGDVDSVDGLAILRAIASLSPLPQNEPCPDVGMAGGVFGDVGCDGALDAVDALRVLRFVAGLPPLNAPQGCPAVGQPA